MMAVQVGGVLTVLLISKCRAEVLGAEVLGAAALPTHVPGVLEWVLGLRLLEGVAAADFAVVGVGS
jgi:hypothetical protein